MDGTLDSAMAFRSKAVTPLQIGTISICILINCLDGFDVLAMAFTGPVLAREWNVSPEALGVLFSAGIFGMAIGSLLIAPLADRYGRRPMLLASLSLVTLGMFGSACCGSASALAITRLVTGLGVGAVLPSLNAMVAEFAPTRRRDLAIGAMAVGYSIGAVVGGWLAVLLIAYDGWRVVFVAGGALSAILIPVIAFYLPESIDYLLSRRPPDALARANAVLRRMGQPGLAALPAVASASRLHAGLGAMFSRRHRRNAALVCGCFFLVMTTFYFLVSWTPKLLVDLGLSTAAGISGGVLMNLAGAVGGLLLGWLASRLSLAFVGAIYMVACFACVAWSAFAPPVAASLISIAALTGFFVIGAVVACYAMAARVFPPLLRATGTGVALGVGRLGGTLGPYVAGLFLAAGWSRMDVSVILTVPMLAAAAIIALVPLQGPGDVPPPLPLRSRRSALR